MKTFSFKIDIHYVFSFHKGDGNHHGTEKPGEPWNKETRRGPKFVLLDLSRPKGTCHCWVKRLIFYFPSGACWYFDLAQPNKKK